MEPQSSSQLPILPSYGASDPPPKPDPTDSDDSPAVEIIRQKIESLYGTSEEPSVKEELELSQKNSTHVSTHQQFVQNLLNSGKSLAEIQTAWHNYYVGLPDNE